MVKELPKVTIFQHASQPVADAQKIISLTDVNKKFGVDSPQLRVSIGAAAAASPGCELNAEKLQQLLHDQGDAEGIRVASHNRNYLFLKVKTHKYNQRILRAVQQQKQSYGYCDDDLGHFPKQRILVEFSSPNIAKPFHAGHLRSTVLGNFISNLYEALGHNVTRLNYLGDWGTQFGLLLTAYRRYGSEENLASDPLLHLFEVYVKINSDVEQEEQHGKRDTYNEALQTFSRLETGDPEEVQLWKRFQEISTREYSKMYQRLGVQFTDIHTESMYKNSAQRLIQELSLQERLQKDNNGILFLNVGKPNQPAKAKLAKSDGSTLYLTRDVVAAIHRYNKYKFDKMHYVVDHSQETHFSQLQEVLDVLGHPWALDCGPHFHVAFGRVEGMSTRQGEVVFLRDILDEAKQRALQILSHKESTRSNTDVDDTAEKLAVSCIIIQDLKEKRRNNYMFSWDRMMNFKSDSGVFLQYCHARLCSVQRSFEGLPTDIDSCKYLDDDISCRLVHQLARYPDAVSHSLQTLEPCHIVQYLFTLSHLINSAYKHLPVKGQTDVVTQARLTLFDSSRQTLHNGLRLLGIQPLEGM